MTEAATQQQASAGFQELKTAIEESFSTKVEAFLKKLDRRGLKVRQFDEIVPAMLMKQLPADAFQSLPVLEQARIREFYLLRLEEVGPELRERFIKVYSYYY